MKKTMLSRTGRTNPLGKFDAEIQKFKVPGVTRDILEEEARSCGLNLTEFCRYILMLRAHGKDELLMVEQQRLEAVAGMGSEQG